MLVLCLIRRADWYSLPEGKTSFSLTITCFRRGAARKTLDSHNHQLRTLGLRRPSVLSCSPEEGDSETPSDETSETEYDWTLTVQLDVQHLERRDDPYQTSRQGHRASARGSTLHTSAS
jgi:hypothetical protein